MATKVLTKTAKVFNMLSSGKAVKVSTVAKKLYGTTDSTSINNARRIINSLKGELDVELVAEGTYKAN